MAVPAREAAPESCRGRLWASISVCLTAAAGWTSLVLWLTGAGGASLIAAFIVMQVVAFALLLRLIRT